MYHLLTCWCVVAHVAHDELHKVWLLHAHQLRHLLVHPGAYVVQAVVCHVVPTHGEAAGRNIQSSKQARRPVYIQPSGLL